VLACDGKKSYTIIFHLIGIWDCLSNQEVVDFIRLKIAETGSLLQTCNLIMEKCLAPGVEFMGIGCDNMTIIIIALLNGKTKEEWVQSIKDDVEKRGLAQIVPDGDTEKEDSEAPEFEDAHGGYTTRRIED
jgi:protein phosphatase 2C family protein 2/3